MSIQSEITRLQTAKANLKTSLENKGATVSSSTKLDGYPTIVDNLPNATKYNVGMDSYLGSVDQNGAMQEITNLPLELVFTGVKSISNWRTIIVPKGFNTLGQQGGEQYSLQTVKSASFPDLEIVGGDALKEAFKTTYIESVSFPKLKYIKPIAPTSPYNLNNSCFAQTFSDQHIFVSSDGSYKGGLKTVEFPELEQIGGDVAIPIMDYVFNGCFYNNPELTSVSFPKLKKITNVRVYGAFNDVGGSSGAKITTTEMPALEEISGYNTSCLFYKSSKITTVNFPSLKKVGYRGFGIGSYQGAFSQCTNLTTATFPVLDTINEQEVFYYAFHACTSLTSVSFGGLKSTSFGQFTSQFNNMLYGVTNCTVHFPSNLQSVIGSWTSVISGFGGTNTTVLFDLPATE